MGDQLLLRDAGQTQLGRRGLQLEPEHPEPVLPGGAALCGKAALAGQRDDIALLLQLPVGPLDGVWIDGEPGGQLPHGGQPFSRRDAAAGDQPAEIVCDLFVNGLWIPRVEDDHAGAPPSQKQADCMNCITAIIAPARKLSRETAHLKKFFRRERQKISVAFPFPLCYNKANYCQGGAL